MSNTESVTLPEYKGLSDELLKNLTGDDGRWWLNCFKRFLRKEDPWDIRYWEAWKTITYGYLTTTRALRRFCSTEGQGMCGEAFSVLKNLETTKEYHTADLQKATFEQLGLNGYASLEEVNKKIIELGFYLVPLELVFNLHYQYKNRKESLFVAMKPLLGKASREFTFLLEKNGSTNEVWAAYNVTAQRSAKTNIVFVKKFN